MFPQAMPEKFGLTFETTMHLPGEYLNISLLGTDFISIITI